MKNVKNLKLLDQQSIQTNSRKMKDNTIRHLTSCFQFSTLKKGEQRIEKSKMDSLINRDSADFKLSTGLCAAHCSIEEIRNFTPAEEFEIKETERKLKLLSIDPLVADRTKEYIKYDGFGRVDSIIKPVPPEIVELLLNSVVIPLTELPVKRENVQITNTEALIDLYSAVKNDLTIEQEKRDNILKFIKEIYLSGDTGMSIFNRSIDYIKQITELSPFLDHEIEMISSRISNNPLFTQKSALYYSRIFDSTFAAHIIKNETPYMKQQISIVSKELLTNFNAETQESQKNICDSLQKALEDDYDAWMNSIPEALVFMEKPTPDNFRALLQLPSTTPFRALLILNIAAKLMIISPKYADLTAKCSKLYFLKLKPQKNYLQVEDSSLKFSTRHGIAFPYQKTMSAMDLNLPANPRLGVRFIDRIKSNEVLTEHDRIAQEKERATAAGISGTSNLLNGLFHSIKDKDSNFSIETAQLLTAASLTINGGHSTNEAYTVFNYSASNSFDPISYSDLSVRFTSSDKLLFDAAVNEAFNTVVEASEYINYPKNATS